MVTKARMFLALGLMVLGLVLARPAGAATTNPANLQLVVTFNGQLSVKVDGAQYSTYTLQGFDGTSWLNPGPSAYAVPMTSVTVINDGSVSERWQLAASTVTSGGSDWQLNGSTGASHTNALNGVGLGQYSCGTNGSLGGASCPGANQYAVQALFVSSKTAAGSYGTNNDCPAVNSALWDNVIDTVPVAAGFVPAGSQVAGYVPYWSNQFGAQGSPAKLALGGYDGPDGIIPGLSGLTYLNTMLPQNDQISGTGQRGLCVRVTMPSSTDQTTAQTIQVAINAF